jgi:hypothetical protein
MVIDQQGDDAVIASIETPSLARRLAHAREASILIRLGSRDEDLNYQAPVSAQIGSGAFLVYFHKTSQLLERVRLYGLQSVVAQFSDGTSFTGLLKLDAELSDDDLNGCPAILELIEVLPKSSESESRFFPLT